MTQPANVRAASSGSSASAVARLFPGAPPLDVRDGAPAWSLWHQLWNAHEILTKLSSKSKEEQIATFLTALGIDALDVFNALPFANEDEKKDLPGILKKMDDYFIGEWSIIYERCKFHCRN